MCPAKEDEEWGNGKMGGGGGGGVQESREEGERVGRERGGEMRTACWVSLVLQCYPTNEGLAPPL